MPKFTPVTSIDAIHLSKEWVDSSKFTSKNRIVTSKGDKATASYKGRRFQIVAKKERTLAGGERRLNYLIGIIKILFSLGLALISKSNRQLFTRKVEIKRYAVPLLIAQVHTPNKSHPKPSELYEIPRFNIPEKVEEEEKELNELLPPLPLLRDLKLAEDSPLKANLKAIHFVNPSARVGVALAAKVGGVEFDTFEKLKAFNLLAVDTEILNISLNTWLGKDTWEYNIERLDKINKDPLREDSVKIIQARIAQLNASVQLEERLMRLKYPTGMTLRDVVVAWDKSSLKYGLMMRAELIQLKLADFKELKLSKSQTMQLYQRLHKLAGSCKEPLDPSMLTKETLPSFLLIDIQRLKAPIINKLYEHLPLVSFALIASAEAPHIDMKPFNKDQLLRFFISEERAQLLSSQQIMDCLDRLPLDLLKALTEKQVWGLDFSKINPGIFEAIFGRGHLSPIEEKRLQGLSTEQIACLSSYFVDTHWNALELKQVLKLDSKIRQSAFHAIFGETSVGHAQKEKLQELSPDHIEQLSKHFADVHWAALSKTQVLKLNLSNLDKSAFQAIFAETSVGHAQKEKLQELSPDQIEQLSKHFADVHWKALKDAQVLKLDFAKMDLATFHALFGENRLSYEQKIRLESLSPPQINLIIKYFGEAHRKVRKE